MATSKEILDAILSGITTAEGRPLLSERAIANIRATTGDFPTPMLDNMSNALSERLGEKVGKVRTRKILSEIRNTAPAATPSATPATPTVPPGAATSHPFFNRFAGKGAKNHPFFSRFAGQGTKGVGKLGRVGRLAAGAGRAIGGATPVGMLINAALLAPFALDILGEETQEDEALQLRETLRGVTQRGNDRAFLDRSEQSENELTSLIEGLSGSQEAQARKSQALQDETMFTLATSVASQLPQIRGAAVRATPTVEEMALRLGVV